MTDEDYIYLIRDSVYSASSVLTASSEYSTYTAAEALLNGNKRWQPGTTNVLIEWIQVSFILNKHAFCSICFCVLSLIGHFKIPVVIYCKMLLNLICC